MTAPVTYTREQMLAEADRLQTIVDNWRDNGMSEVGERSARLAAMLRQAAAEGQGNEMCMECGRPTLSPSDTCPMPWHPTTLTEPTPPPAGKEAQ